MKQKVLKSSLSGQIENQLEIRKVRYFSEPFKKEKVQELIDKRTSVQELHDLYGVSRQSVYRWLYRYSPHYEQKSRQVVEMESESQKTKFYQNRVAELERIVGQKQLEIDFQSKLIEIASAELGIDLKKNFSTQVLNGSASIEANGKGTPLPKD